MPRLRSLLKDLIGEVQTRGRRGDGPRLAGVHGLVALGVGRRIPPFANIRRQRNVAVTGEQIGGRTGRFGAKQEMPVRRAAEVLQTQFLRAGSVSDGLRSRR